MEVLLLFAFLSGLVTIFAPCIWPLLPIILSASTTGGHKKPLGISLGIISSFALITLSISYIVKIIPFDPEVLRYFAVAIIGFLGLTLVIPALAQRLEAIVSRLSGKFGNPSNTKKTGFISGFITGFALGIVWTPCAGPILATIATLAATQAVTFNVVLVTVVYVLGVGIPLFLFATAGSTLFTKSRFLSKYTGTIQQLFGVLMILAAVSIATGYDKTLQAKLLEAFPSYGNIINQIENNDVVQDQLNALKGAPKKNTPDNIFGLPENPAPEFTGITNWLNTQPLTIASLRGKVVLIDFWTYTCINCIRTLPYVTRWYETYKDQGFVVVGVHAPEFEFEKDTENVKRAIKQYNITYPVAQDNNFATWTAYNNQYWPAKYLIDAKGMIRYTHFGEGQYVETEKKIQTLLKEAGRDVSMKIKTDQDKVGYLPQSPETYLGSKRMEYLQPDGKVANGQQTFTLEKHLSQNRFSFGGTWIISDEYAASDTNAVLSYNFNAERVFLVLKPGKTTNGKIQVFLDGKQINTASAGKDVINGSIIISEDKLYDLVDLKGKRGNHLLELHFLSPGTQAYAFTFG